VAASDPPTGRPSPDAQTFDHVVRAGVVVGVIAAVVAGAAIWLLLTDPVTVATAVDTGEISPLAVQLAQVIIDALAALLEYL
jgi:hypothetical protein